MRAAAGNGWWKRGSLREPRGGRGTPWRSGRNRYARQGGTSRRGGSLFDFHGGAGLVADGGGAAGVHRAEGFKEEGGGTVALSGDERNLYALDAALAGKLAEAGDHAVLDAAAQGPATEEEGIDTERRTPGFGKESAPVRP